VTVVANELRGFYPSGGMGTATTYLALALARMGHEVEILIGWRHSADAIDPDWGGVYRRAGIRVRSVPRSETPVEPPHFEVAHNIATTLRADPPDVVVVHDLGGPAYAALRLRQAGVALERTLFVVFCHGTRRYILDMSLNLGVKDLRDVLAVSVHEQASVELADVVVSPSAFLVDWMRRQGWRLPEHTLVIPYFTRSSAVGEPAQKAVHELDEPLKRLAFFGRIDERKGVRVFAAGLNALAPALLEGIELEFVGKTTATWPRERIEALLSDSTRTALRSIAFETGLDQHAALARLSREGTLTVMPTLQDNSPNTVYECLERDIPFIASDVGGVPELIAPEDRPRVLFEPSYEGVTAALRCVLERRTVPAPAQPGFSSEASFARWGDVVDMQAVRGPDRGAEPVDVVVRRSGRADLPDGSARFVLVLDEEDVPDPNLVATLVRAQRATNADVVTSGLRLLTDEGEERLHFFSGDPGGAGALANEYGGAALIRRSCLTEPTRPWPDEREHDWPLLAGLAASGARIVSIPLPLVTRKKRPARVEDDPVDALLVLDRLERALPEPLRSTARLAAGLAADSSRRPADHGLVSRARRLVRRLASRR
jgi:glycosyltransferase involved in cell wall biosynthesis